MEGGSRGVGSSSDGRVSHTQETSGEGGEFGVGDAEGMIVDWIRENPHDLPQ